MLIVVKRISGNNYYLESFNETDKLVKYSAKKEKACKFKNQDNIDHLNDLIGLDEYSLEMVV